MANDMLELMQLCCSCATKAIKKMHCAAIIAANAITTMHVTPPTGAKAASGTQLCSDGWLMASFANTKRAHTILFCSSLPLTRLWVCTCSCSRCVRTISIREDMSRMAAQRWCTWLTHNRQSSVNVMLDETSLTHVISRVAIRSVQISSQCDSKQCFQAQLCKKLSVVLYAFVLGSCTSRTVLWDNWATLERSTSICNKNVFIIRWNNKNVA